MRLKGEFKHHRADSTHNVAAPLPAAKTRHGVCRRESRAVRALPLGVAAGVLVFAAAEPHPLPDASECGSRALQQLMKDRGCTDPGVIRACIELCDFLNGEVTALRLGPAPAIWRLAE